MEDKEFISLRHYFEILMAQYKESHAKEHLLETQNVEHARRGMEVRLETMNEFRAQILSERGLLLSKDKYDANYEALTRRIGALEIELSNLRGRMTAGMAALGVGLGIVQLLFKFVVK